jgi:thiol-disulfide isomerase/thioredoxin
MTLALGAAPPAFALPAVDGSTVTEHDGDGPLVVAFWCNHCPYVQAWEERMNRIALDYAAAGVRIVAVNANDASSYPADAFPEMAARARDRGFAFAYAQDATQETARAFGAQRTPEVFVFDGSGALRYHGAIDDSTDAAGVSTTYLRDALDAVLEGGPVAVAETPPVGCTIKWVR